MRNPIMTGLLLASAAMTIPALASPYKDIYLFGDSLFDNGQFDGLRFTNRVGPDYQNSAYGPVSPNYVATGLGLPVASPSRVQGTNYAVGGNESSQTLQSITAPTTYQAPCALDRPGSGLNPNFNSLFYDLERRDQNLVKNALYNVEGGGNDLGNGKVFDDATAAIVSKNLVDAANALKTRGAKYVVITNVPDLGLAPAGIAFGDFASSMADKINTGVRELVGTDNILIFNAYAMVQEVAATPELYGLPLTSQEFSRACFSTSVGTCSEGNANAKIDGANPDPDQFFFNDPLHPVTIGQHISGDYLLSLLTAPGELALLPQMGTDDMQSHWRSTRAIMQSNRWQETTKVGGYSVWGGAGFNEDKHDTDYNNTGTNEATQYNVGVSFRPAESWYMGAQLGRADNELDFGASASRYEMDSLNITLLGGWDHGPWFAEGMASYSDLDYDELRRSFSLGPILSRNETADTSGSVWGIKLNAGLNVVDVSKNYRFGPTWSYEYIDSEVDGYSENGDTATNLWVKDMSSNSGIGSAGVFGDLQLGFCDCNVYSELTYRAYLVDGETDPRIGLKSVPGNSAKLPGYKQDDDSVHWDVGMSARLGRAMELTVNGGMTDADYGDAFWYGAELIYSF